MKKISLIIMFSLQLIFIGCQTDSISWEMHKVLWHYKYIDRNKQKYEAAKFLIENMPYHKGKGVLVKDNPVLLKWRNETDSIYYSLVRGLTLSEFPTDSIKSIQQMRRKQLEKDTLPNAVVNDDVIDDSQIVNADFLISHIDNAFTIWKKSRFSKHLSFDEFKEYILPYRCINGYGFLETGQTYNQLFAKYVMADSCANIRETIKYYNKAVNGMRDLNGKTHRTSLAGLYDLYSRDFHDCVDIASYGGNILRACGVPVVVEYNICYRYWAGRHFQCSIYDQHSQKWTPFSPESSLPEDGKWDATQLANIYRYTYAAQKNTPYFLRNVGEDIPVSLADPCIKDVTSNYKKTLHLTLPFHEGTNNKLAYLATFNRENGGVLPITWGIIDTIKHQVHFNNVIPDLLYFPIFYPSVEYKTFGLPFIIEKKGNVYYKRILGDSQRENDTIKSLILTRKFPYKKSMKKIAENLVGGKFLGANQADFSDAVILYEIKEAPLPLFAQYKFNQIGCFRYYRFQSPAEHPQANLSMLEWITSIQYNYPNSLPPTTPHILCPKDTILLTNEHQWVKLLDADSWDDMSWKAEYDGNMQTSPGAYPNITFALKEPIIITGVRFAPRNADNGIHANDRYMLYYWENGWVPHSMCSPCYEYVTFKDVPAHKLYWLRNISKGKEEMPFYMHDDKEIFIYQVTEN